MAISSETLKSIVNALVVDNSFTEEDIIYILGVLESRTNEETALRDIMLVRRGNLADLPILAEGELGYTLDTKELFIGNSNGTNTQISAITNLANEERDGLMSSEMFVSVTALTNPSDFPENYYPPTIIEQTADQKFVSDAQIANWDSKATGSAVTSTVNGLMTAPDKVKLDGIAVNANNYSHPNHTGDITSTGDGVTAIAAGVIVNADVNAAAAIAWSKLDKTGSSLSDLTVRSASDLTSGTLSAARLPAISGDITISAGSSTAAITAGVIVNADISASAAIDATKIGAGVVSNTEYGYLDGVTSAIQSQINAKVSNVVTDRSAMRVKNATVQNFTTTNAWNKINYDSEIFDHLSEYTPATNRFTASAAGIYMVSADLTLELFTGGRVIMGLFKNGVVDQFLYDQIVAPNTSHHTPGGTRQIKLAAGDYIEVHLYPTIACQSLVGASAANVFEITRIA